MNENSSKTTLSLETSKKEVKYWVRTGKRNILNLCLTKDNDISYTTITYIGRFENPFYPKCFRFLHIEVNLFFFSNERVKKPVSHRKVQNRAVFPY